MVFHHHYFSHLYQNFFRLVTNFLTIYFPNLQRNAGVCLHCCLQNLCHSPNLLIRIFYLFQNSIQPPLKSDTRIIHFGLMLLFFRFLNNQLIIFRLQFFKFNQKALQVLLVVYLNFTNSFCLPLLILKYFQVQKLTLRGHLQQNPNHFSFYN